MSKKSAKAETPKAQTPQPAAPQPQIVRQPMMMNVDKADEIISFLSLCRSPERFNPNVPFLVGMKSMEVFNLEKHMPHPPRIRKDIRFIDAPSFLQYFQTYKESYNPMLFAASDASGLAIKAIFDYDVAGRIVKQEGQPDGYEMAQPHWNDHVAYLHMSFTPDYKLLKDLSDKLMKQEEFAFFVEENLHLFSKPTGAEMLELAQELKGTQSVTWKHGKRLSNGETSLEYVETIDATSKAGDLKVPESITFKAAMFEGFEAKEIKAAFRFRFEAGKVTLGFKLLSKKEERDAEKEVRALIEAETNQILLNVSKFEGTSVKV